MAVVLTRGQRTTLERLKKNDFQPIKQADITRLLGKMLDTKQTATDIIPKVIEYEQVKFPQKSLSDITKYLTKKIKAKDDRAMFREVLSEGDFSQFPDVSKDKAKAKQSSQEMFEEKLPMDGSMTKKTPSNGSSNDLEDLLDRLLSGGGGKDEGTASKNPQPFSGEGRTVEGDVVPSSKNTPTVKPTTDSINFSDFFDMGSSVYKENEAVINKVKNSLTKQKLNDGSWFTGIASLEAPELEILQKVVDMTPLGFSKDDKDKLGKMLSRDADKMSEVSTSDSLKLVGKLLVNPDQIGTLIKTRTTQWSGDVLEGVNKFYRKLTGQKEPVSTEIGSLEDIINSRRDKIAKDTKRKADLAKLMGLATENKTGEKITEPQKMAGGGMLMPDMSNIPAIDIETGKITGDKSNLTAEQILTPPTLPNFKNSTWSDDLFGFLKGVFVPDVSTGNDKEKFLEKLKETDPSAYNKYQEAMRKYNNTKKKLALNNLSDIDLSLHKEQVKDAFDFSRKLLEKASSLKELTNEEIETVYDISGTLDDVLKGTQKITYNDLNKIQRAVFDIIPVNVFNKSELSDFTKKMMSKLGAGFDGDSKLGDYDFINKLLTDIDSDTGTDAKTDTDMKDDIEEPNDEEPEEEKYEDGPVKETKIDTSNSHQEKGQNWSTLRPRLAWGGTDEIFMREKKEVQQANLIAEAMSIEPSGWGNGADNKLYKMNLIQDDMRYRQTFRMPEPPPQDPLSLPSKFIQMTEPIMNPQYAPVGRKFEEVGRDPYLYGQYQQFNPSIQETVYPSIEQRNTQHYPHISDARTGGEIHQVGKWDYLTNIRFTS